MCDLHPTIIRNAFFTFSASSFLTPLVVLVRPQPSQKLFKLLFKQGLASAYYLPDNWNILYYNIKQHKKKSKQPSTDFDSSVDRLRLSAFQASSFQNGLSELSQTTWAVRTPLSHSGAKQGFRINTLKMLKAKRHVLYSFVLLHKAVVHKSYSPKWNKIFDVQGYSFQTSHCPRWTA